MILELKKMKPRQKDERSHRNAKLWALITKLRKTYTDKQITASRDKIQELFPEWERFDFYWEHIMDKRTYTDREPVSVEIDENYPIFDYPTLTGVIEYFFKEDAKNINEWDTSTVSINLRTSKRKSQESLRDIERIMLESDILSFPEQCTLAKHLLERAYIDAVIFSGNKSLHMIKYTHGCSIPEAMNIKAALVRYIRTLFPDVENILDPSTASDYLSSLAMNMRCPKAIRSKDFNKENYVYFYKVFKGIDASADMVGRQPYYIRPYVAQDIDMGYQKIKDNPDYKELKLPITYYDVEVYPNAAFAVIADSTGYYVVDASQWHKVFIRTDRIFLGFNSNFYDDKIVNYVLDNCSTEFNNWSRLAIWEYSQNVIHGSGGFVKRENRRHFFKSIDSRNFSPSQALSVKKYEAARGLSIEETPHPFHRHFAKPADVGLPIRYCCYDVAATQSMVQDYCQGEISARKQFLDKADFFGLSIRDALYETKAGICVKMCCGDEVMTPDRRQEELVKSFDILFKCEDDTVRGWFENLRDDPSAYRNMKDEDKVKKVKLEHRVDNNGYPFEFVFGLGGLHGAIVFDESGGESDTANRLMCKSEFLRDSDVASYYPNIVLNHSLSNKYTNLEKLRECMKIRLDLKRKGDKEGQAPFKIVINGFTGTLKAKIYATYSPSSNETMTVNGQIMLFDLSILLVETGAVLIQVNTDGIMYLCRDKEHLEQCTRLVDDFGKATGFDYEHSDIKEFYQEDVNSYWADGKVKGSHLVQPCLKVFGDGLKFNLPDKGNGVEEFVLDSLLRSGLSAIGEIREQILDLPLTAMCYVFANTAVCQYGYYTAEGKARVFTNKVNRIVPVTSGNDINIMTNVVTRNTADEFPTKFQILQSEIVDKKVRDMPDIDIDFSINKAVARYDEILSYPVVKVVA